jgi:gliding motility-associated-like protein
MRRVTFDHSKSYINRMKKLFDNIGWGYRTGGLLRRMLLPFILIFYFNCNAQTYCIPDTLFTKFLKLNHPSVLGPGDSLLIDSAKALRGTLDCSSSNIKDLRGLEYFININHINCSNNQLTNIPSLAGYNDSLMSFDCSNNQLTSLPAFRYGAVTLKSVNCNNNLFSSLSSFGYLPGLDTFQCKNNYLDFNDLNYFATLGFISFIYAPQFNPQITVPSRVELQEGDVYTFPYPHVDTVPGLQHTIFKNSISLANLGNANTFKINSVQYPNAGFYSWQLTDSLLPGLTISTTAQELVVLNKNNQIFTPDGDNNNDYYQISCDVTSRIYDKNGILVKELQAAAYWDGTDLHGKPLPTGAYIIRCGDKHESSVTLIR